MCRIDEVMLAAVQFSPIFVYVALGLAGIVVLGRLLVGWAVDFS
jgi:hypothetical protein